MSPLQGATRLDKATDCCMNLRPSADSPVWPIELIGKIISHAACDTVPLCVLGADSQECSVTGGWIDKTKDQIDTFSPGLIARWESKLFFLFFFLKIMGPDQTFNIALASRVQHACTLAFVEWTKALLPLSALCLPVNPGNSVFQQSSLQTGENLMKSQCLN